jgi:hypothetical protein
MTCPQMTIMTIGTIWGSVWPNQLEPGHGKSQGTPERSNRPCARRITRRGRKAAVVVSAEEWERKMERKGNLAEFFASSPLRGARVRIKRSSRKPRKIEL